MPCNSNHMNPNERERYNQTTAQLWQYVVKACNIQLSLAAHRKLNAAASDIYCGVDYTPNLCAWVRQQSNATLDAVMYNGRHSMARRLADWWEKHEQWDRQRIVQQRTKIKNLRAQITKLQQELAELEADSE